MICENCKNDHNGEYTTGRFCSMKCSKSFATKFDIKKNIIINCKKCNIEIEVDKRSPKKGTLCFGCKSKPNSKLVIKNMFYSTCYICNEKFIGKRKYCSSECRKIFFQSEEYCLLLKKPKGDSSKMGGIREGGGRSKSIEYFSPIAGKIRLNKDEIEVAKLFDKLELNWKRNWDYFKYIDLYGTERKFYPDFYLIDYNLYVEYKGWIVEKMIHKMNDAIARNDFKLLIIVSERFKEYGSLLNDIKNDPGKYLKF